MLTISVNGKKTEILQDSSLEHLVLSFTKKPEHVIAEVNGKIVPEEHWKTTTLLADDKIELVTFVGGG